MKEGIEYILAHGSGNLFVMIDAEKQKIETTGKAAAEFVRRVCRHFKSDGVLFLERVLGQDSQSYLAMNMYNTDGTQAEMCGNGMRLIARLAYGQYLHRNHFTLYSGGRPYPINHYPPTYVQEANESIKNYGVKIAIRRASQDFTLSSEGFVAGKIAELHPTLCFTYLNLGNPHIVAEVQHIDLDLLSTLGERVKELKKIFPNGINVSLMKRLDEQKIYVATYERGVGLTASCGTAMTASSTTAALLGLCRWGEAIEVRNQGGFVRCICHTTENGELYTELIGNATYIKKGLISLSGDRFVEHITKHYSGEKKAWKIVTTK